MRRSFTEAFIVAVCVVWSVGSQTQAQFAIEPQVQLPPPAVNWTAEQDHQNMMDQLGIKALRPGPSGNENDPNHANYEESLANPYPNLPDVLTLNDGNKVTTPEMWWKLRRPEIQSAMDREVYGRVPKNVPGVTWTVKLTDHELVGRTPVLARHLIGHVDNSSYPLIDVNIDMVVVTPANAKGPVPLLIILAGPLSLLPRNPTRTTSPNSTTRYARCLPGATLRCSPSSTSIPRMNR